MDNKKMVPELRFSGFTSDWVTVKLNQVTKIFDGTHQTPKYKKEGVPFYSVEHLTADQFEKTKFISEEAFQKEIKRVKLEKNDLLMTRIGSIGKVKHINWDVRASFYVSLALIKSDEKFESSFLAMQIRTQTFQRELWQKTIHVAFPIKINLGEIGNCPIYLTCKEEQQKIAHFLTAIDQRITLLKEKKAALEHYKKGLMQKIFSQEVRFTDDEGNDFPDWEETKLGDIASLQMGTSPKSSAYNEEKNGLPLIQGNADINNRRSSPRIYTSEITKECRPNDLLLSVRAPVGEIAKSRHHACIGRGVAAISAKTGTVIEYLYQYLLWYEPRWRSIAQGSTFESVNSKDIVSLKLKVPYLEEQQKIANFLSAIDQKINAMDKQITDSELFKKGLLQRMFV